VELSFSSCDRPLKRFYNYLLIDTRTGQAIYAGKAGCRKGKRRLRMDDHVRKALREGHKSKNPFLKFTIQKILRKGFSVVPQIVFHTDNEAEVFAMERQLIASIGRADKGLGPLCNLTDGGEGPSGYVYTEALKQLRRDELNRRYADPVYKAKHDAHMRAMAKDRLLQKRKGEKVARTLQDATVRQKYVDGATNHNLDPKVRMKKREDMLGEKNHQFGKTGEKSPNFGRKFSPATIEKIKASAAKRDPACYRKTVETRRKRAAEKKALKDPKT
jgi:hypothetical protein